MTNIFALILAGGVGSRLWPVSREMFPKQMLKIDDDYTLFQRTFLNLTEVIDDKNIISVTSVKYASMVKQQLKELKEKFSRKSDYKIISEPVGKNTAPAIAIGTRYISDNLNFSNKDCVILAVPSDHLIFDRKNFAKCMEKGTDLAKAGYLVTFSTQTEEINENLGYMKTRKNPKISEIEPCALKVTGFIEKPDTKEKKELLKGKKFVNSGMYMFTPEVLFSELKKHSPEIINVLKTINPQEGIISADMKAYDEMPSISIDYAVAEKTNKLVTVPLDECWKDIGSWNAIYEISPKDLNGNYFNGKVLNIGSKNSLVYSPSKLTAVTGLEDKTVIVTEDAVLVSDRNDLTSVKKLYSKLTGKNAKTKEIHETVYRPWGYYKVLEDGEGFLTKCITVNPEQKLSLQLHHHRSEHWIVLEGVATVIKGSETFVLQSGESIDINVEEIHSIQNHTPEQLKIMEIQQGDILDENDIERLEDIYGRV